MPKSEAKTTEPKYRHIFKQVQQAILSGQHKGGEKIPSEASLVRRFGTSRPTVIRALRELELAGYIERRVGSGSYVRLPAEMRNKSLGLLIPELGETEIFEPICGSIARALHGHDYNLLWGDPSPSESGGHKEQAERLCRRCIAQKVAGVFFAAIELTAGMKEFNRRIAEGLDQADIPIILLDRDLEVYPQRSKFDLVSIDNRRAGYRQTEHLLKLGCRRIEYIAKPLSAPTVNARIVGFRDAMSEYGVPAEQAIVREVDLDDPDFIEKLLDPRPADAYVCANDITAANVMQHLLRRGIRIPDHVRVVGLDDVKYARLLAIPLTTLRQPCRDLGAAAVAAMFQRIENRDMPARDILFDCKLIVRESSGAGSSLNPATTM